MGHLKIKNIILSTFLVFFAGSGSIYAQEPADIPVAPAAPNLRDDDLRRRSIDMERTKRDAAKSDKEMPAVKSDIDAKFPEIKEDFEGMQIFQSAIVKAYTTGEKINYEAIATSADEINKHAARLNINLFAPAAKKKKDKPEDLKEEPESVKNLIVKLDNAILAFSTSTMFKNLRTVEPEIAGKAQSDLAEIIKISAELSKEAKKMK